VLGDFNRDLLHDGELWPEIDDGNPPEADLVNAAEHTPFRNCTPGQGYTAYIDFIVLARSLGAARIPNSFERITYAPIDARRAKLADHCPVAVSIRRN